MSTYQRDHSAYKFQMTVDVIFHKAVDPTVITQPAVTLTLEMVAVYEAPPLEDINRQLLNLVEIYKHNGSGWVFSHFDSLQLTLWYLDPLCASASVPLPQWIRDKKATTNIIGTGNDCFKWAVLAGMHPTTADNPNRMVNYVEHACGYDFSSLCFPVSLSSIAPFAPKNNLSINVYGVEDEKKVIFLLCVTDSVVPGRHVDLLLYECNGDQHYSTIKNFTRLISSQLSNHGHAKSTNVGTHMSTHASANVGTHTSTHTSTNASTNVGTHMSTHASTNVGTHEYTCKYKRRYTH